MNLDIESLDNMFEKAKILSVDGKINEAQATYTNMIDIILGRRRHDESASPAVCLRNNTLALAYNNRGHLRYLSVDFEDAVDDYTEAIKHNDKLAVAYYNRGQIHYRLARFELGIEDFKTCLKIEPTFEEAKKALETAEQDKLEKDKKRNLNIENISTT